VYDPYYWGPRWVGATRVPATRRDKPSDKPNGKVALPGGGTTELVGT
jgi:hypothetical protein